jgi:trans-2,3-dihydro-3-hydroxyanthranilate isomerase
MDKPIFYIVDVFAEEKFSGNQLAVFRFVKELSDAEMQRIAKEMNFSETTFILSDEKQDGGYDVRIFTPDTELPFAGHPTLGTAFVIQHEIIKEPINEVILNLKAGQIPVSFSYTEENSNILWMKQLQPIFGETFDAEIISEVLSLDVRDIDENFPVQDVSTGLPVVIVPLKTLDALKRARIIRSKYFEFTKDIHAKIVLIFCPETYKMAHDLNVRVFADHYGIPEDPATGSANGCLAAYLVKHRYFEKDQINLQVEQGYEIGRPSLLLLKAEEKKQEIAVYVGGKVEMIAKGEFI